MNDDEKDNETAHFWRFANRAFADADATDIELDRVAYAYDWYTTGGNTENLETIVERLDDRDRILLMIVERLDVIAQLILATTASRLEAPYGPPGNE